MSSLRFCVPGASSRSILVCEPDKSLQKKVFNISTGIPNREDVDLAIRYPVDYSPGPDNQLTISSDPLSAKLGNHTAPAGKALQAGRLGPDLFKDLQGFCWIVFENGLEDCRKVALGYVRPKHPIAATHFFFALKELSKSAKTWSWSLTLPSRTSASPWASSFNMPRALRVSS